MTFCLLPVFGICVWNLIHVYTNSSSRFGLASFQCPLATWGLQLLQTMASSRMDTSEGN